MASIFKNPGQWLRDTGKAIERDWRNAGRGEIGRFVSGVGQSAYNVAVAVPNAVRTGDYDKHLFQKGIFSAANLASLGTLDYLGGSSGFQRGIGSDPIIGKNIAAFARVTRGGGRDATVKNEDRNLSVQGAVKIGAAAAAYYGGVAAYDYYSAPNAVVSGAGDYLAYSGGAPIPGVLTAPAYGSSGAGIGSSLVASSKAAAPIAFSETAGGFISSVWTGTKELGKTILTTGLTQKLLGGGGGGGSSGMMGPDIGFSPGGVNISLPGSPGYYDGPIDGYVGGNGEVSGNAGKILLVGALAVGALVIYKAVRK